MRILRAGLVAFVLSIAAAIAWIVSGEPAWAVAFAVTQTAAFLLCLLGGARVSAAPGPPGPRRP